METFKTNPGKSRAPLILVGLVGLAVIAGAVVTSRNGNTNHESVSEHDAAGVEASGAEAPDVASRHRSPGPTRIEIGQSVVAEKQARSKKMDDAKNAVAMRFEQEPADARWSAQMEGTLQALADAPSYKESGVTPTDLRIDCRTTICKVTATHPSYSAAADWAMLYMTSSAGQLPKSFTNTTTSADGTGRVEIYGQAR
ncbi:MAG: hypothetical protein ABIO38_03615 [Luteimonas sp.]